MIPHLVSPLLGDSTGGSGRRVRREKERRRREREVRE